MLRKVYSKWKREGLGGLFRAVLLRCGIHPPEAPLHLACYETCQNFFQGKIGLEVGGPSGIFRRDGILPVYGDASRIDNCNFGRHTIWEGEVREGATFQFDEQRPPGDQYIVEATRLESIASSAYDFMLSSHTLEHTANPLLALSEWTRVLKPQGVLLLVVPHRDGTFDHRRPVTSLAHLAQDFERQTPETDLTHLEEILQLHDLAMDPPAGDLEAFRKRSLNNAENRCLHHHVFDTRLAIEVVQHVNLQILAVEAVPPFHIVVIAQKPLPGMAIANERFRDRSQPVWRSPFPTDRHSVRQPA